MWSEELSSRLATANTDGDEFAAKLSMASSRRNQEPQDYAIANVLAQVKFCAICAVNDRDDGSIAGTASPS
jgi:hypothetical protein